MKKRKRNMTRAEEIKRGYRLPDADFSRFPMPRASVPRQETHNSDSVDYQGYTIRGNPGEPGCTLYIDDEPFKDLPEQVLHLLLTTSKERDRYRGMVERMERLDLL